MKETILITGVAGFIGSHLAEFLLTEKYRVIGVDNFDSMYPEEIKKQNIRIIRSHANAHNFTFYRRNILNVDFLFDVKEKINTIIHIAAKAGVRPSIENPQEYINTNIVGTQNVLAFAKEKNISRLLFASSSSIYGNNKKVPFSETDNVDYPISPYAFTKKANELQLYVHHKLYFSSIICLRFFTVYGPRQRPDLAIRKFISRIESNQPIEMYGNGSTKRDYTYIEDIVKGIYKAMVYINENKEMYDIVNLGSGNPISLKRMIDTLYSVLRKEKNILQRPMQPGDVDQTFADINKAKNLLGYEPKMSFELGVKKTIEWLRENNYNR